MGDVSSSLYTWLLFGHILAAMVWVGSLLTLIALAVATLRGKEPQAVPRFFRNVRMVAPWALGLSTFLVVGLGSWMVADSHEWDPGQTWVWLGIALFAAAIVVGALFPGFANKRAERAVAKDDHVEAARQLRMWAMGMGTVLLLLVIAVWDMVFKPGT